MPYPDIKVYVAFCKGVPVYYEAKEDSGITTELVYEYVVPRLKKITVKVSLLCLIESYCRESSIQTGKRGCPPAS